MPSRRTGFQNWVLWTRKHVCPVGGPVTPQNDSRLTFATCGRTHPHVRTDFDWSMGRREDSDIKTSYKSWRCGEVDGTSGSTKMADVARRNYDALGYYGDRRDAAWIVDKCDFQLCLLSSISAVQLDVATRATTGRQQQNVSVDLIPDCGRSMCGSRRECLRKIAAHYRFVIISTDTDCFHSPYELIYDAFEFDVVPVLLASPREAVRVPSFSVVYSAQFHGLGDLASHLRMLATNREAYEQYFLWKERCSHVSQNLDDDDVCPLCIALNDQVYNGSTRSSAGFFWSWMTRKRVRPCDACARRMPGFHWAFSPIFKSYRDWQ
ncbi:hypothetical protein HPB52_012740 [Rhipicephalus sanguineus]|uniref:Fucosyltransferase n=2 Tax=Rhipicephalus sanguineus TaxID=34632 RepID=A0A9D4QAY7_RHISA|nr:hypothetical protein HPB52_012740 [Rhipicephalus sanguineus]